MTKQTTSEVVLEFSLDESELQSTLQAINDDLSANLSEGSALEAAPITGFLMPVRLRLRGIDLFTTRNSNQEPGWRRLPLLALAIDGRDTVRKLAAGQHVHLALWAGEGWLTLRRIGDMVEVTDAQSRVSQTVRYPSLMSAFDQFSRRCRLLLAPLMPDIRRQPNDFVAKWLYEADTRGASGSVGGC